MHRSNYSYSEKLVDSQPREDRRVPWESLNHVPFSERSECSGFSRRPSRKQYLWQLLAEFEKCAQQSEDVLLIRKEFEQVKRGIDEIHSQIEDIKFESKISGDKVKFLSKDLQEAKSSHFKLRDEISKEFRKTYKRLGAIDKDIDLIKYRQTMAVKKHQLDLETLKWEMTSSRSQESPVCSSRIDIGCFKTPIKKDSTSFGEFSLV
ncbi:uncharacterized protein LOC135691820 [Rhopilema esculentum]|uniref:uncharacterized protein LOC135691820 n=1 Tax=Rhopilema esculentum TaxID=499914 RepID=UPI0031CF7F06|eukprot:gene9385-17089_t